MQAYGPAYLNSWVAVLGEEVDALISDVIKAPLKEVDYHLALGGVAWQSEYPSYK